MDDLKDIKEKIIEFVPKFTFPICGVGITAIIAASKDDTVKEFVGGLLLLGIILLTFGILISILYIYKLYKNEKIINEGREYVSYYKRSIQLLTNKVYEIQKKLKMNLYNLEQKRIVCESLISFRRVLLVMNAFGIREKIGKILIDENSNSSEFQKIEGYIDFLGWNYILKGTPYLIHKGKKYINKGVMLAIDNISSEVNGKNINDIKEYCYYLARAYRHLGTTEYILENKYTSVKFTEISDSLNRALLIIYLYLKFDDGNFEINEKIKSEICFVAKFESKINLKFNEILNELNDKFKYIKCFDEFKAEAYNEIKKKIQDDEIKNLISGVYFNQLLLEFYIIKTNEQNKSIKLTKLKDLLEKIAKEENETGFFNEVDNHRIIKVNDLKNEIKLLINELKFENNSYIKFDINDIYEYEKRIKDIDENIKLSEKTMRKSIYFDASIKSYIEQKIEYLDIRVNQYKK